MAPPSKHKAREDNEDISMLRRPITLHGKPVEQILNSIHYGSPELRNLLMNECDIIFECKVCRALFRDVPNFISHKRRYCSQSAADLNHFAIGAIPNERVVIVEPQPVDPTEIAKAQASSSSSQPSLEESLDRIRKGEIGSSYAFQVYSNAAAKLRHQKDHGRITSLRKRDIPTNPNAVFIDVNTTAVNIHDRQSVKHVSSDDLKAGSSSSKPASSSNRRKASGKKMVTDLNQKKIASDKQLRSKNSTSKASSKSDELTDRLMKELKVIQNKVKNKTDLEKSGEGHQGQSQIAARSKVTAIRENSQTVTKQKINSVHLAAENCKENSFSSNSNMTDHQDCGVLEMEMGSQNFKDALVKTMPDPDQSSKDSSDSDDIVSNAESSRKSKKSLICPKCGSIFSSRKSLQYHIRKNHAVNRKFFPCPCCSNVYYYFHAVTRHLQINHSKTKKEINDLRETIRSKVFSRPLSSPESTATKSVVKRAMLGSRRSVRSKDGTLVNKKAADAPYIYSSITKGKKLSAKKDPVLSEEEMISPDSSWSETDKVIKPELSTAINSGDKTEQAKVHVESPRVNVFDQINNLFPIKTDFTATPVKSSGDIAIQMQTCGKCSRLFGRQATYENHIKVCNAQAGSDDSETISISTRRKTVSAIKPVSTTPTVSIVSTNGNSNTATNINSRSRRFNQSSSKKEEVDIAGDLCKSKFAEETGGKSKRKNVPFRTHLSTQDVKTNYLENRTTSTNPTNQPLTPEKSNRSSIVAASRERQSLPYPESHRDSSSSPSPSPSPCKGQPSIVLTRLKANGDSLVGNSDQKKLKTVEKSHLASDDLIRKSVVGNNNKVSKSDVNNSEDKSVTKMAEIEITTTTTTRPQERPKRKRKVPSRNVEAEEFLQKIHRSNPDIEETSGKKIKNGLAVVDNLQKSDRHVQLKDKDDDDDDEECSSSRTRNSANKIFVLNNQGRSKNKLECYNQSKVEKFMDKKKLSCLKCGLKQPLLHNLKRHIMRVHLKWSRFQCKLCPFKCFDKSECNTHIVRHHRKGRQPGGTKFLNTLIIDLAKKGSKAMSLKKHQTIKAKSQEQEQEEEKNIYRNQNALKHPRLPERKLSNSSSNSSPSPKKSQVGHSHKQETTPVAVTAKMEQVSPTSSISSNSSPGLGESDKIIQSRKVRQISHLVPRKPRLPLTTSPPSNPLLNSVEVSPAEKIKQSSLPIPLPSISKSDNDDTSSNSKNVSISTANSHGNSGSDVVSSNSNTRRAVLSLPFNISTRKSPRVFDTSPYSRDESTHSESAQSVNKVVMQTRHGVYTKTLPVVSNLSKVKETTGVNSTSDSKGGNSVNVKVDSSKVLDDENNEYNSLEKVDGSESVSSENVDGHSMVSNCTSNSEDCGGKSSHVEMGAAVLGGENEDGKEGLSFGEENVEDVLVLSLESSSNAPQAL